jgi:protocatechuate 3,4-dioxygenase beta subunit
MRSSAILCLLAFAAIATAQPEKSERVAGIVVNSVTGAPLPRVQIHLRIEPDAQSWGTMTAPDGRFAITGMPPGAYSLTIERAGFSVPPDLPEEMTLGDGSAGNLHFALVPDGSISGRVTDAAGQPAEDVELLAEPDFDSADSPRAVTDANGKFRIGGLAPGQYRLRAFPQNTYAPPEQRSDGTTDVQDAPTRSHAIQVASSAETSNVDLVLSRVPIVGVNGKVESAPPGAINTQLLLESRDGERTTGGVKPDGTFRLWRLYPGDYELQALWQTADGATIRSAPAAFHIEGANVDNIHLHPAAPTNITGRIVFDDDAARPAHGAIAKLVLLNAGLHTAAVTADIAPDGSFEIPNVPAGRYRPSLTWDGAYVTSGLLDLTGGPVGDLNLHASSAVGTISGVTAPGSAVILVLDGPGALPRVTDAGANGAYSFHSVAPGAYRIVALPQPQRDAFLSRAGDYRDLTENVEIHSRQKLSRNLTRRALTGR